MKEELMNLVIVGHVDHGKSTIIGRLLADTNSLPEGKLEQVKETCRRNSKPFEYAFLLDALKEEQSQGITIDAARIFFKTDKRKYIILDAPGHIEFLKNMITGAARAEAALLVIDAEEGIKENSKRHGYMLSLLGINQVCVLVNKMDLVGYSETRYNEIVKDYSEFLKKINIDAKAFIPVSGMKGDNIVSLSENLKWYSGKTVLEMLDDFEGEIPLLEKEFRMPVQGVYKFTKGDDKRRIIAGTIESGSVRKGDEVIFYPSGRISKVKSIEAFNKPVLEEASAGEATGFTLEDPIYVKRGEVACLLKEKKPKVTSRIKANLFWLGNEEMKAGKEYVLKTGTSKTQVRVEEILNVMNTSSLDNSDKKIISKNEVGECILKLETAIAFDLVQDNPKLGRFVIVDDYKIKGGGIIVKDLEDKQKEMREKVLLRNYKWEKSSITRMERAERYNQKPVLVVITGEKNPEKKEVAKLLEKELFSAGKYVYFLGIGNVLYGVDADIKGKEEKEHIRRLGEVSNILLDAGMIVVLTATELTEEEASIIKTSIGNGIIKVWMGELTTNFKPDLQIPFGDKEKAVEEIKKLLKEKGAIFNPW